jgi:hypothetical protein
MTIACSDEEIQKSVKSTFTWLAVMNGLGYLPIIGTIIGIVRIIFTQCSDQFRNPKHLSSSVKELRVLRETQLVRGLLECVSVLGILMLITDIAVTALVYAFGRKSP